MPKNIYKKSKNYTKNVLTNYEKRSMIKTTKGDTHHPLIKAKEIKAMTKNEMIKKIERDTEELEAGAYIVRWTSVLSNRFDTTAFKKTYGDLYKTFTKQVSSKRFCISC